MDVAPIFRVVPRGELPADWALCRNAPSDVAPLFLPGTAIHTVSVGCGPVPTPHIRICSEFPGGTRPNPGSRGGGGPENYHLQSVCARAMDLGPFRGVWDAVVFKVQARLAANVYQVTPDQMELGPSESDTGRSCFLLSPGCDRSRYYRVAYGTGPIPHDTQFPCRTLGAYLVQAHHSFATASWAACSKHGPAYAIDQNCSGRS